MEITALSLAMRYVGVLEIAGTGNHPLIQWWHSLCGGGLAVPDDVPWCSSFCNGPTWELRLPRSKSKAARSWLTVGTPIYLSDAKPANDVVILTRAGATKDPNVLNAPGHVGFYAGYANGRVLLLGGNQSDAVSVSSFPDASVIGVRRLAPP